MFPIRIPGGARAGKVTIPKGADLFRLSDGAKLTQPSALTIDGTSAIHDVPGGSPGFLVSPGDTCWVRSSDVTFLVSDATPFDQADIDAAVAKATENMFTVAEVSAAIAADRAKAKVGVVYE